MVRLLDCQKTEKEVDSEDLRLFAIAMLCSLLEIFESDLTADELREIELFAKDWCIE